MKILILSDYPQSVCSYYRMLGPLVDTLPGADVRFASIGNASWADFIGIDLVGICRPESVEQVDLLKAVKVSMPKCRIWLDIDDWLFGIPSDNPNFLSYQRPDRQQSIADCIALADIFTVSTQDLADKYKKYCAPGIVIEVVKNTYRDHLVPVDAHNETETVYWRGSPTHLHDVQRYAESIMSALRDTSQFHIFGWWAFPFINTNSGHTVSYHSETPILQYLADLRSIKPAVCVVPLVDSPFNRCKSNIAWIEATLNGAVTVAPALPEWERLPGVYLYNANRKDDIGTVLRRAIEDPLDNRKANWEASMNAVRKLKTETDAAYWWRV